MPSVNDLFCGCGGMGLGFKKAGFRLVGAWDFDKYAVSSYGHNVSPKVKQDDITTMNSLPYADVWTFGFPCQDISVAGKQAGMIKGQTRSGLFYEVMRLLEETKDKPKIILAENVKAVKKYLPEIEKEYAEQGYKMTAQLYNSKYWGVPQNRERYFIVGVREDIEKEFIFPEQQTEFVPKLSSILETEVDEKYYISDEKAKKIIEQAMKLVDLKITHSCVAPTLTTSEGGHRRPKILTPIQVTRKANEFHKEVELSHTLLARDYKGFPNTPFNAVIDGFRVRKLTPREYARLQGFPDSFEQVVSNSQFYKQMGNAVTVNVSKVLAESISDFLS